MSLNAAKSCGIRIGHRHDKSCNNIVTLNGLQLSWVNELRYLGIFIVSARCFRISLDHAISVPSFERQMPFLEKSAE